MVRSHCGNLDDPRCQGKEMLEANYADAENDKEEEEEQRGKSSWKNRRRRKVKLE